MSYGSANGIAIRTMQLDDYPEVKGLMGKNFYDSEPLNICLGDIAQSYFEKEQDDYHITMIEQGTCLVAIDQNDSDRIVGIVLAGAQVPEDLEENRINAIIYGHMYIILSNIELELNIFERYGVSKVLYSHITHVDATMRGKGLGARLAAALMEVGREKRFPLMIAYCTSFYSARQKEALGMKCIYSLAYTDYKNEHGEVVFRPPPPHTHVRIMLCRL